MPASPYHLCECSNGRGPQRPMNACQNSCHQRFAQQASTLSPVSLHSTSDMETPEGNLSGSIRRCSGTNKSIFGLEMSFKLFFLNALKFHLADHPPIFPGTSCYQSITLHVLPRERIFPSWGIPEVHVRLHDGEVRYGNRRHPARGKNKAEDEALEQDLLADEKEKAEHLMLVDLARNDIGSLQNR